MKSIKTEITINAPINIVWGVLMDYKNYPNWNPFITQISGSSKIGEQLSVTIKQPEKKPMNFSPSILKNDTNTEFRWVGHLFVDGLFDGEHYFMLERITDTETRFIHGENFTGLLAGAILKLIEKGTQTGFNLMNEALKIQSELVISNQG